MSNARTRIVVQCVADEHRLGFTGGTRIDQTDIVIEGGLTGRWAVLAPVTGQLVLLIGEASTLEKITEVVHAVIVEGVGIEISVAMAKHHAMTHARHLVETIVVKDVTC